MHFATTLGQRILPYKVIVLPNVTCLSDAHVGLVHDFVHRGGGLVVTCNTAKYNEDFEQRDSPGFVELTGEPGQAEDEVRRTFGEGRVAYFPRMPGVSASYRGNLGWIGSSATVLDFPNLPPNWEDLLGAVRWAAGGELPLEVEGPGGFFVNAYCQESSRRAFIHAVNLSDEASADLRVRIRLSKDPKPTKVMSFSPDFGDEPQVLPVDETDTGISFVIPVIDVYTMVSVQY